MLIAHSRNKNKNENKSKKKQVRVTNKKGKQYEKVNGSSSSGGRVVGLVSMAGAVTVIVNWCTSTYELSGSAAAADGIVKFQATVN